MNKLPIVELFYSLQGEGNFTGQAAIFIRLAGCPNACSWCDAKNTWNANDFPLFSIKEIVEKVRSYPSKIAIITGGEPLLHSLDNLCSTLQNAGFRTHIETSGVEEFSGSWNWICLSPKRQNPPIATAFEKANELKIIISSPTDFAFAEENAKKVNAECLLFLQPEWSQRQTIVPLITDYIQQNPQWRLSLQTHKFLNIP